MKASSEVGQHGANSGSSLTSYTTCYGCQGYKNLNRNTAKLLLSRILMLNSEPRQ